MTDKGPDTHQQTAGVIKDEVQSTPLEAGQEGQTTAHLNAEQEYSEDSTSLSASTEKDCSNYLDKKRGSFNVEGNASAENASVPSPEGSGEVSEECSVLNTQGNTSCPPEEPDHGDNNTKTLHEESTVTSNKRSDEDRSGDKETAKLTQRASSSPVGDQADGPPSAENEESPETGDTRHTVSEDDDDDDEEQVKDAVSEKQKDSNDSSTTTTQVVEEIGPMTGEETELTVPEVIKSPDGYRSYWILVVLVVLGAVLVQHLLQHESPPAKIQVQRIDLFLQEMAGVKAEFPSQRRELWSRSQIHLRRHLQTAQPTEPVSLILTAGLRAERTLRCLAERLATAFSTTGNASVLHIDGASKANQDSDHVKLDIDSQLQGAFEGDKLAAVIHRFEELPPGATLIFYRYCDHENAAYKKTFLIFTVLLGEEVIPAEVRLSTVEEMVDDHLQRKFLAHGRPAAFDRMDIDKYGGLWSRISHLILPVAAEDRIEQEGC